MKIFTQTDTNISIKKFKEQVREQLGEVKWIEEKRDFSDVPWGEDHVLMSWLEKQLNRINKYHRNTIDVYFTFIKAKNWKLEGTYGLHLGESYRGSRICLVRNRKDYVDTAMHELLHALWSYIHTHTGVDLEEELGVSENGAIHGDAEGYEEYEYNELFENIKPYYEDARGEDMADEYRGLAQTAIRAAQKLIRRLSRA